MLLEREPLEIFRYEAVFLQLPFIVIGFYAAFALLIILQQLLFRGHSSQAYGGSPFNSNNTNT